MGMRPRPFLQNLLLEEMDVGPGQSQPREAHALIRAKRGFLAAEHGAGWVARPKSNRAADLQKLRPQDNEASMQTERPSPEGEKCRIRLKAGRASSGVGLARPSERSGSCR